LKTFLSTAESGLKNTEVGKRKRVELARRLASFARDAGKKDAYRYAITECFYSAPLLDNYIPILELDEREMIAKAVKYLDETVKPDGFRYFSGGVRSYYAIHFLNNNYNPVFETMAGDGEPLGWGSSVKGVTVPLFIGLLAGFDERAPILRKIVEEALECENPALLYRHLQKNKGPFTAKQEQVWYQACVSEAEKRADAIVAEKLRGSYFKAARLLVAVAEMRLCRGEETPFSIVHDFLAKYPRHRAFKEELRSVMAEGNW
jgi:hypothetical protein